MESNIQACVFVFDSKMERVFLQRKHKGPTPDHPNGQKGLLNGFGGKGEPQDRTPVDTALREGVEELGLSLDNLTLFDIETYPSQGVTVYYFYAFLSKKFDYIFNDDFKLPNGHIGEVYYVDPIETKWPATLSMISGKTVWNVPYLLMKAMALAKMPKEKWPTIHR